MIESRFLEIAGDENLDNTKSTQAIKRSLNSTQKISASPIDHWYSYYSQKRNSLNLKESRKMAQLKKKYQIELQNQEKRLSFSESLLSKSMSSVLNKSLVVTARRHQMSSKSSKYSLRRVKSLKKKASIYKKRLAKMTLGAKTRDKSFKRRQKRLKKHSIEAKSRKKRAVNRKFELVKRKRESLETLQTVKRAQEYISSEERASGIMETKRLLQEMRKNLYRSKSKKRQEKLLEMSYERDKSVHQKEQYLIDTLQKKAQRFQAYSIKAEIMKEQKKERLADRLNQRLSSAERLRREYKEQRDKRNEEVINMIQERQLMSLIRRNSRIEEENRQRKKRSRDRQMVNFQNKVIVEHVLDEIRDSQEARMAKKEKKYQDFVETKRVLMENLKKLGDQIRGEINYSEKYFERESEAVKSKAAEAINSNIQSSVDGSRMSYYVPSKSMKKFSKQSSFLGPGSSIKSSKRKKRRLFSVYRSGDLPLTLESSAEDIEFHNYFTEQ